MRKNLAAGLYTRMSDLNEMTCTLYYLVSPQVFTEGQTSGHASPSILISQFSSPIACRFVNCFPLAVGIIVSDPDVRIERLC